MEKPTILDTFRRTENKYTITIEQRDQFLKKAADRIQEDFYYQYTVHNLYLDTATDSMIISCLNKPDYKEKLRLRSYGTPGPDNPVFLEIKKKYESVTVKRRIATTLEDGYGLVFGRTHLQPTTQIEREIAYAMDYYRPCPKVFAAYDRTCMAGVQEADLRITFDTNLRYRFDTFDLDLHPQDQPFLDPNTVLMEIKAEERYPLWLVDLLRELGIHQGSFSKYGAIYTRRMQEQQQEHPLQIADPMRKYAFEGRTIHV